MPNLPFFTLAPAISPAQPASAGTTEKSYTPFSNQGAQKTGPVTSSEMQSDTESSSLSFYQALNDQLEEAVLPVGQELAAYIQDDSNPLPAGLSQVVEAQSTNTETTALNHPIEDSPSQVAPWLAQAPIELDDIQQQRAAQVQLQGSQQPQKQNPQQLKWQGEQLTSVEPEAIDSDKMNKIAAPALQMQASQTAQANLTNPMAEALQPENAGAVVSGLVPQNNKALMMEENRPMDETGSLLDGDAELANIHEKPLTLNTKQTSLAPAIPIAPAQTAQVNPQAVAPEISDALIQASQSQVTTSKDGVSGVLDSQKPLGVESTFGPQEKLKLDVPPNTVQWSEQISKRITIMNKEGLQSARIQLDPPELGALEIKVKVTSDQVHVGFTSNQPAVREALEAQTPRLREMMEQEGINLADVNVSDQGQQPGGGQGSGEQLVEDGSIMNSEVDTESSQVSVSQSDSLVDYFA